MQVTSDQARALLRRSSLVFWDFDGVVKDSVAAKSDGFERLFLPFGREIAARVRRHHEEHGGVSRFEKIPVYLGWAGEAATPDRVTLFCEQFSRLVLQAVIDAAWVPGVREYLQAHHADQHFVLVTATPQGEIEHILRELGIATVFREVRGAPIPKVAAIREALSRASCPAEQALMVGDAEADLRAAEANGVPFLMRRTPLNRDLDGQFGGPCFDDLGGPVTTREDSTE